MQLPQYAVSLICMTVWGSQLYNMCIWVYMQLWRKQSRKGLGMGSQKNSCEQSLQEAFFLYFTLLIMKLYLSRNYAVRFGEEAWCWPLSWREARRLLPDPGARGWTDCSSVLSCESNCFVQWPKAPSVHIPRWVPLLWQIPGKRAFPPLPWAVILT